MIYGERLTEIARRKERLAASAAHQRAVIAAELGAWQKPLDVVERAIAATRFLKAHPGLVVAAVAVAAILGRRSLLRWVGRGLILWRGWRTVQALLRGVSA